MAREQSWIRTRETVPGRLPTRWSGQSQSAWPLMLLLVVAVAVPAACVLWFMTEAMRNEQLAVRGRLTAMYQGQLETLRRTPAEEHVSPATIRV